MKKLNIKIENWLVYIMSILVLIVSFLFAYFLPMNEIFKGIAALPGIGALCLTLYKSWKDEQLQNKQQDFVLGTASHMADVIYNKHVEFCEEYIGRVQKGFQELLRDGPSKNSINIGRELVIIRRKNSAWLTRKIEKSLEPFERALIKIGANEHYLEMTSLPAGVERNAERKQVIDDIFKSFGLILGHEKPINEEEADLHIDRIVEKIRDILGINILTELRIKAAELAIKRINGI